jgi:sulfur-oxidizing protein SoxY
MMMNSRRAFLKTAALIGLISSIMPDILMPKRLSAAEHGKKAANPQNLTPEEAMHIPKVDVPIIAEDGSLVPIIVSVNHPMEPDHYIKSIYIVDDLSAIPSKGLYRFTPANGEAYISTRIKLGESTKIRAIAECNKHGKWENSADIKVTVGGC